MATRKRGSRGQLPRDKVSYYKLETYYRAYVNSYYEICNCFTEPPMKEFEREENVPKSEIVQIYPRLAPIENKFSELDAIRDEIGYTNTFNTKESEKRFREKIKAREIRKKQEKLNKQHISSLQTKTQ